MIYAIRLEGTSGLLMHSAVGSMDTRAPANVEKHAIARRKASDRTEADEERMAELECQAGLWLDDDNHPTIPAAALRAVIETSARKLKQGPQVREGLVVDRVLKFEYDEDALGKTIVELGQKAQFKAVVAVQRNRLWRVRPLFPEWAVTFLVDVDDELVDAHHLGEWLDIGGRRIGLGDWRPEKSGSYGRFRTDYIKAYDPATGQVTEVGDAS